MTDLKPCPFCGDAEIEVIAGALKCCGCGAIGPCDIRDTIRAKAAWNTRAEGLLSPSGGGATEEVGLPERVTGGCADAGPCPHSHGEKIAEVMDEGDGFWRPCSGCQESVDGYVSTRDYPRSSVFRCQPGAGCHECGGLGVIWDSTDYGAMVDAILAEEADEEGGNQSTAWRPDRAKIIALIDRAIMFYDSEDFYQFTSQNAADAILSLDGGEAVHARPLSAASAEPKDGLSGPTGEVGGVPEGWVLVPREPTEAMTRAWWRSHFSDDPVPGGRGDREAYQAMIAAAPPSREGHDA